ncbi:PAS domain-containing sensor histidine kinase [Spirochaetia bacterium]|nr:PAS domain-containing sensor histidine kinase [Spirochaetia bacterium]
MRNFFRRTLTKLNKMTDAQMQELFILATTEIDRLETVLDSINKGVLVCDANHNLRLANKAAEKYLHISSYEQGNEPVWQVVRNERIRNFFEETLQSGDRIEGREFYINAKNVQRLLSIDILPLVQDRRVTGSLISIEDITEKRSREAQMRRMENLASLTTLAAGVAHEIKNPLGSLSIHVQLIQKTMAANKQLYQKNHPDLKSVPEDQDPQRYFELLDKYIDVVNEEIERLNHIVVDFLFAVRPMHMDFQLDNINSLIEELFDFVHFELEEAHIDGVLHLAENLPLIEFDERYMKQALLNLVKNAIAAMNGGGTLTFHTGVNEAGVVLSINDTGEGIPEENLSKIFEPYFTTKETGSGLGLILVYKIVKEHQGEITVNSRVGEGTCFSILLPIPQKERRLIGFDGGERQVEHAF